MPELPVLNRIPHFDNRSRNFAVRQLIGSTARYKRVWAPRILGPLDQGREGACVGFSWAAELAATPHRHLVDNNTGKRIYEWARVEDRAMGNNWPEGASVLAGAKACLKTGYIGKYYWAFGIDDVIDALVRKGPLVLGINWRESMYQTTKDGLVQLYGRTVGGHAIMANGYWPKHPIFNEDVVVWTNSWGMDYGVKGRGFIRVSDLATLLSEDGEACIPTDLPVKR
jgi:hypothetical protein